MGKNVLSSSIVAALFFSLLQPAVVANAVDAPITKTFSITKSDGTAYSGVNVALLAYDQDLDAVTLSAVATTDVSGRAAITVPADSDYYGWTAQPGVGDLSHALMTEYVLAAGESEEISVSLKQANLSVSLFNDDGITPASAGSYILYPASEQEAEGDRYRTTIREGAFGIDLSPRLLPGEDFEITIEPSIYTTQFGAKYGLRTTSSGGSVSYSVFSDTSYSSPLVPDAEGVYKLSFELGNFAGQLRNSAGSAITLPAGVRANVEIFKAKQDGTVDFLESAASVVPVNRNGSFSARIFTLADGKYFPRVITSGSLSLSSFLADPFWIVNGAYSSSAVAGSGSFSYTTRFPAAPNLKIEAVKPNGSPANETYISVNERSEDGQTDIWWNYSSSSNGTSSFNLPDGVYEIFLEPNEPTLLRQNFDLMVDGGVAIVTNKSGDQLTPDSSGVFELSLESPNMMVKVVDPVNPTTLIRNVSVEVHGFAGEGYEPAFQGFANSGTTGLQVPDGEFRLTVSPQNGLLAAKDYGLVVNGSSIEVTDLATDQLVSPDPDGYFVLTPNVPNLTGTIFEKLGEDYVPFKAKNQKWAQVHINQLVGEDDEAYWPYVTSAQVGPNGNFSAFLSEPGTYRLYVNVSESPNALSTEFEEFVITDTTDVRDFPRLELRQPAFKVAVRQSGSSQDLEDASVGVIGDSGQEWFHTGQSGLASVAIDGPGTYSLLVQPPYSISSAVAAPKAYELTAVTVDADRDELAFTVLDPSDSTEISLVSGAYVLPLGTPNVIGKLLSSAGEEFDGDSNQYANLQLFKRDLNGNWEWTESYSQVFRDGTFGFSLEPGVYRLEIDPYGIENSSTTRVTFTVVDGVDLDLQDITLSAPTASFVVRTADDPTTNLSFASIEIRKDGEWFNWINVGEGRQAKFTAEGIGEYEFILHPNGDIPGAVGKSYTGVVSLDGDGKYVLTMEQGVDFEASSFVLRLGTPNVIGEVQDSEGNAIAPEDDNWIYIQVQRYIAQDDRWEWTRYSTNVRSDSSFALGIEEAGTYRLRIEAGGRTDVSLTFSEVFEIEEADLEVVLDLGSIQMNAPTLIGQVLNPDQTVARNAMVIAIDQATGNEMWDYSAYADSDGQWSMMLPEGSYSLIARPAWRDSTKANSAPLDGVTVNDGGVATIAGGIAPDEVILELREPTWSGTVVSPTETPEPLEDVSVCLYTREGTRGISTCAQTDGEGRFGLSLPIGFTGFNDDSTLTIRENRNPLYAEARFVGKDDVEEALDMTGLTDIDPFVFEDIVLSPLAPNATFTITDGENGAPSPNTWVSIQADNQWLGGSTTNQLGQARLFIPTDLTDANFIVEVQPNSSSTYTGVRQSFPSRPILELAPGGTFEATIALGVPNFKGILLKPGGGTVRDGRVDAYNETLNTWSGGRQTNAQGAFSLRLDAPESSSSDPYLYRITAHPSWSDNSGLFSRVTYFAKVSAVDDGDPLVQLFASRGDRDENLREITSLDSNYTLELRPPTVTGTVLRPGASGQVVRDSFVVPIDVENNRSHLWELGQHSRANGSFGLALEDGIYQIFANAPGQLSNFTRSALCDISVTGGLMSSTDSDCATAEGIKLTLREPNLVFDLVNELGDPVAAAHVGVSVGSWHGWSQSSPEGTVSLLIDTDEIKQSNPDWTSGDLNIRFNVQAPYGNTDVVSWQCAAGEAQPLCEDLTGSLSRVSYMGQYTASQINLGDIVFQTPNTTVVATDSSGDVIRGAWINLSVEEEVEFGGTTYEVTRYVGSGSTTDAGLAVFYVAPEDQNKTFHVSVYAPWELRQTQVHKSYPNVSLTPVGESEFSLGTVALGSPNLSIRVRQADTSSTAARWSSVWVEELNSDFTYKSWVIGFGTDESGVVPISLDNGTYRITANPGPGSKGARTSCTVSVTGGVVAEVEDRCVDGAIAAGVLSIGLSPGNFRGSVYLGAGNSTPATGAIVFAQAYDVSNNLVDLTQESVVDSTGTYGLELDPSYNWKVSVFYVNLPGALANYQSITGEAAHSVVGLGASPVTQVFNLGVAP